MISFLRKIRQNLISQNSFSKYLLYAIGEVLLVVIGILIALQINNWNEKRKDNNLQQQYIQRLVSDLEKDFAFFKQQITIIEERNQTIQKFTSALKNNDWSNDKILKVTADFFEKGWLVSSFTTAKSTFDDLTSTGQLNIITNVNLRNQITTLYKEYEDRKEIFKLNNEWLYAMDIKLTLETNALQYDSRTKNHFELNNNLDDLKKQKQLYQRVAASHDWANQSALRDYHKLLTLVKEVLDHLRSNLQI